MSTRLVAATLSGFVVASILSLAALASADPRPFPVLPAS